MYNPQDLPVEVELSFLRRNQLFHNAIGESDNFRLRATGWSGEGRFIVFGSRIANGSQDATTFEMMVPAAP